MKAPENQGFNPNIVLLRRYFQKLFIFENDEVEFDQARFDALKVRCDKWGVDEKQVSNLYWIILKIPSDHSVNGLQKSHDLSSSEVKLKYQLKFPKNEIVSVTINKKTDGSIHLGESDLLEAIRSLIEKYAEDADRYIDEKNDMRGYFSKLNSNAVFKYLVDQEIGTSTDNRYFIGGWLMCLGGLPFLIQRDGKRNPATEQEINEQPDSWFKDNFEYYLKDAKH